MNEENNYNPFSNMDNNNNVNNQIDQTLNTTETVAPSMSVQPQMFAEPTPVNETPVEPTSVEPVNSTPVAPVEAAPVEVAPVVQESVAPTINVAPTSEVAPAIEPAPVATPTFEQVSPEMTGEVKKKNKTPLIIGVVVAVLAICALAYFVVTNFFLVTGKNVVKTSMTKVYDYMLASVDKAEKKTLPIDFSKDSVGFKGDISFSSNFKYQTIDLSNLEKYKITYDTVVDLSKQEFSLEAALGKEGKELIDGAAYLKNKILSLASSKLSIYSYTIEAPEPIDFDFSKSFGYADVKLIINKAKKISIDNINESNITKTTENRSVSGVSKSYTKVTYKVDTNEYSKQILTGFKDDNEVLDALARITGQTVDKVKEFIENELKDLSDDKQTFKAENNEATFNIFVDGAGKFVALDAVFDGDNKLEVEKANGNYSFKGFDGDKEIFHGNYLEETKTLNYYGESSAYKYEVSVKEVSDTKTNIAINFVYAEDYKLSFNVDLENVVNNNSQTFNVNAKITYTYAEEDPYEFGVKSNMEITKGATVKEDSNMFTRPADNMTEEELEQISNKLQEIYMEIISDFMSYDSMYPTYDDYDYMF